MAGGLDVDGNGYPDFVVGAYESDSNIFILSIQFIILWSIGFL